MERLLAAALGVLAAGAGRLVAGEARCDWAPRTAEYAPGRAARAAAGERPFYRLQLPGDDELVVCPRGWNDCDRPEDSAHAAWRAWLDARQELQRQSRQPPELPEYADLVRQLLLSAEPYRSTTPPRDACAEATAPRTRTELVVELLDARGGAGAARCERARGGADSKSRTHRRRSHRRHRRSSLRTCCRGLTTRL